MTLRARLLAFFPALHFLAILGALCGFVVAPGLASFALIPVAAYLFPLLAFRLHNLIHPLHEGTHSIVRGYSPWFGTHMIQQGFISLRILEEILRLFPGLFAFWLRLWGAQVGKGVYFAPAFEIGDRSLVDIGDGAVFGYGVRMSSHVISPSRAHGGMKIYIKRVTFGARCFIGATSGFGPGVVVKPGALVRATTEVFPDAIIEPAPKSQSNPEQTA